MGLVKRIAANVLAVVVCVSSMQFPTVYAEAADKGVPEMQDEVVVDYADVVGGLGDGGPDNSLSIQPGESELLLVNDAENSEISGVQWNLDDNGVLTISGQGSMDELADGMDFPWHDNAEKIKEVVIEDGIIDISIYAFPSSCINLKKIIIPGSVLEIGRIPDNLTDVEIPANKIYVHNNTGWGNLTNVKISEGVERCVPDFFSYCSKLQNVQIAFGVRSIVDSAFSHCESLAHIELPESITSIGDGVFSYCTSLAEIELPDNMTNVGDYIFYQCSNLKNVKLPAKLKAVSWDMFSHCSSLDHVDIPASVTDIEGYAFDSCINLENIEIPENVTTIGMRAFKSCSKLASVKILNQDCVIYDDSSTIPDQAVIYGYPDSPAQAYAQKYGRTFEILGERPPAEVTLTELKLSKEKTEYNAGDNLNTDDLVVTAVYSDGTSKTIAPSEYAINQIDMTTAGKKTLEVTYQEGAITKKAVIEITVKSSPVTANTYKITFDANGGSGLSEPDREIEEGKVLGILPTVERAGYALTGWYTEKEGGTEVTSDTVITSDVTIYARWKSVKPKTYRVTFEVNGGDALNEPDRTVEEGKPLGALPTTGRTGYTFVGWYTEKEGGTEVTSDTVITSELTVYAHWEPVRLKTYKVTFDANGGNEAGETVRTVEEGNMLSALPEVDRAGYIFAGWYTEKEGGTEVTENTSVRSDMTVYARWEPVGPITYKVTFEANGGTELSETDRTAEAGTLLTTLPTVKRDGYVFTGWYKDSGCTALWKIERDQVEADIILYAGWTPEDQYVGVLPDDVPTDGIPEGLWIAGIQEYTYTGAAIRPKVRVYNHDRRLKEGRDYTVSYKNNIKAADAFDRKAPVVIVKGKGNYSGTVTAAFSIEKARLTIDDLVASSQYPAGSVYTPIVTLEGNVLKAGTDYTITWLNETGSSMKKRPVAAGDYSMHIVGKGNCRGKFDFPYTVGGTEGISIEKGKAAVDGMEYGGKLPVVSLTLDGKELAYNTDYTVIFSNIRSAGTATAAFVGIGNYTGTIKKSFEVRPAALPEGCIHMEESVPYEKGGAKPSVAVSVDDRELVQGVDYTVSYKKNTKLTDEAQVIVKGKGNYTGSLNGSFRIQKKDLNSEGMRIVVSDAVAGKNPTVTLFDTNGKKLASGKDYRVEADLTAHTIAISGGTNGLYTADAPIIREYEELYEGEVITSVSLNKKAAGFPARFEYTGGEITLDQRWLTVKAGKAVLTTDDFEIIGYINNMEKGTATAVVQGTGDYSGTRTVNFKIQSKGLPKVVQWFVENWVRQSDK